MREILFRGKCKETGRWFTGQYIHLHKTTYCVKENYEADKENNIHQIVFEKMTDWGLPNRHLRVDVIPETVGQYTGLTDKNGKEIFEGDIVKAPYIDPIFHSTWDIDKQPTEVALVKFDMGQYYINYIEGQYRFTVYACQEYIEVIGNIHDNPKILKGE